MIKDYRLKIELCNLLRAEVQRIESVPPLAVSHLYAARLLYRFQSESAPGAIQSDECCVYLTKLNVLHTERKLSSIRRNKVKILYFHIKS